MKPLALISLIGIVLSACDFEPSGVLVTNVQQPSTDGLSIDLNYYPAGPIKLGNKTTFTFSTNTNGKDVLQTIISVDENENLVERVNEKTFIVDPALLSTGSHVLHIEVVMPSESGSLADKADAEVLFMLIERELVVDHSVPNSPSDPGAIAITSVENIDGTIVVDWKSYTNINFQSYKVWRKDYDRNGVMYYFDYYATITDSAQSSFADKTYLYGKSEYFIELTADGHSFNTPVFTYDNNYEPGLTASINSTGLLTIKWNSLKTLQNNLAEYKLIIMPFTNGSRIDVDKYDALDTVYTMQIDNYKFGQSRQIQLHFYNELSSLPKTIETRAFGADPFPVFMYKPHFDVTTEKFYGFKWSTSSDHPHLLKWDPDGTPVDSTEGRYRNMEFAPGIPTAIGTVADGTLRKIDLVTMLESEVPSLPPVNIMSVSDNNRLMAYDPAESKSGIYTESGEILTTAISASDVSSELSANGLYATGSNKLYKFNGSTYEFWSYFNGNGLSTVSFLGDQPFLLLGLFDRIQKFDIEGKAVVKETTTYKGPCNYDPVSQKLGCLSGGNFVILNPDDLTLHKSLPVEPVGQGFYYFFNETIVCPGAQIKLSDIP